MYACLNGSILSFKLHNYIDRNTDWQSSVAGNVTISTTQKHAWYNTHTHSLSLAYAVSFMFVCYVFRKLRCLILIQIILVILVTPKYSPCYIFVCTPHYCMVNFSYCIRDKKENVWEQELYGWYDWGNNDTRDYLLLLFFICRMPWEV